MAARNNGGESGGAAKAPKVVWDDSQLRTTYANVCNVSSTREEVVVLFGVNQSWHAGPNVTVQLQDRIILSPHAAKRLSLLLAGVVGEYEKRFGELEVIPSDAAGARSNG
jgi:hypothetical protein